MKATEITAYKTSDGKLFEDDHKADAHQLDILGESLDALLPTCVDNFTRVDRHRLLMAMLEDKELLPKLLASSKAAGWGKTENF